MIVIRQSRRRSKHVIHATTVPSLKEIREMTAVIRESWSPRERRRRANIAEAIEVIFQMPLEPRRKGFPCE
jgi:hypothetical protein